MARLRTLPNQVVQSVAEQVSVSLTPRSGIGFGGVDRAGQTRLGEYFPIVTLDHDTLQNLAKSPSNPVDLSNIVTETGLWLYQMQDDKGRAVGYVRTVESSGDFSQ